MVSLSAILKDNKFTSADLPEFESKLFFEGDETQRYLVRFSILLFLSSVIATQGVIEDSTATVIGAMIIAPLMTPIVATTAAILMGNAQRAWSSFLLVVGGAIGVIIVSAGFGIIAIHIVDVTGNSQIEARVFPRLIDLIIALAAGTAGAFAICRSDIADSNTRCCHIHCTGTAFVGRRHIAISGPVDGCIRRINTVFDQLPVDPVGWGFCLCIVGVRCDCN